MRLNVSLSMATLSATQLLHLPLPLPTRNPRHAHFHFHSLSLNPRLFSFKGIVSSCRPLQAILNTPLVATDAESEHEPLTRQALPTIFSCCDCILHAQTGSGKTLTYLLLIFSAVNTRRSAVQALVVVPTGELGMQVRLSVLRRLLGLAAKPKEGEFEQKLCTVMALLDGGMLTRHKSWLKFVQMLEKQMIKLESMLVLVIDEVDFMFSSKQIASLRKLLTSYSSINTRQTIFASASIPQHRRFLHDCIQQKWTKNDAIHVHVNPVQPMPSCFYSIHLLQGGSYLLVSTDIAARGVDLPDTTHIYNFDLPRTAIDHLHRAGRTGRKPFSDKKCSVTNIIMSEERFALQKYENELTLNCEELIV
ncbi:DEAD-box ATP-dependent RNA helicase 58 [Pyrus ussuriensis x Pyrus communis]|uniref:RNA helicase n=1 Tax=Pyrus ussuriensis x Pyrus communis TaxID=2448454 RepID=A0A5N5F938_9ROSA|nr:DEAD-box ATP-dependent RNA helicase 58 [Pyrus ussuriensis x Pyrus communis]